MFNPAINAALLAAAHDQESEESIRTKLREAKALNSFSAIPLDLNEKQQELLRQALGAGTIVKIADGRFYLNERKIAERKEGHGFMLVLMILVIGSVIASVAVLATRAGG